MEVRSHWNKDFTVLKEKNYQPKFLYPVEIPFRNKSEIHWWKKNKICCRQIFSKRNARGSSSGVRKIILDGNLKFQEWRKNDRNVSLDKYGRLFSPLNFVKVCMIVGRKNYNTVVWVHMYILSKKIRTNKDHYMLLPLFTVRKLRFKDTYVKLIKVDIWTELHLIP